MALWKSPPKLTVSEWADLYRKLSPESSAEAGTWRTSRAEYQRGIMDAISDPTLQEVVVIKSAQVGLTELLNNTVGYYMHQDPSTMLLLQPTLEMAQTWSKDRLSPMLRDTPAIKDCVKDARSRDSGSTILHKALCINTPVLTSEGMKTVEALGVSDVVYGADGKPCNIIGVTGTYHNRPCYKVVFSDGTDIVCDAEHLWVVREKGFSGVSAPQSMTTQTIMESGLRYDNGRRRKFYIENTLPVDMPESRGLVLHPYALGVWLGDGMSHQSFFVCDESDREIISHVGAVVDKAEVTHISSRGLLKVSMDFTMADNPICPRGHDRREVGRNKDRKCSECRRQMARAARGAGIIDSKVGNSLLKRMRTADLINNKHVPDEYLMGSSHQRAELLRGLMDTDGSIRIDGLCVFSNTNEQLIDSAMFIARSLGMSPRKKRVETTSSWRVEFTVNSRDIPVFKLSRKLNRQMNRTPKGTGALLRHIDRIERVDSVAVKCITVDNDSHLFLAGDQLVPTHNSFAGGHITMAGANSPASLASRPIRIVLCDEVDRFPVSAGSEGDPIALAKKRSTTYHNRKLFICSTPTIKGESRIEAAFMSSDQRYYFMPCVHCDESIKFEWKHVHWPDKEPHKAAYWCQECGGEINDREKTAMVKAGEWSPTSESHIAGFHINELYSPWVTFGEMAVNFVEAKKLPETLKTWINTALGETWEESGESIDEGDLSERCEVYPAEAPEGVLVIVAGADVQDDRLEIEYLGVGADSETWSLGYEVIYGDPSGVEIWQQFDDLLMRKFEHELGRMMPVSAVCIDTGGHHTQDVYKFCKTRFARRVFAIKGVGGMGKPLVSRPTRGNSQKVRLFSVGVDTAKDMVYSRLKVLDVGAGFCHFPADYSEDYFKQLTAEKAITKYVKGRGVRSWVKKSGGRRNEALDCRVYALAAFELLNANMKVLESRLKVVDSQQGGDEKPVDKVEVVDIVKEMAKPRSRRRRKNKSSMGFKAGGWG